MSTRRNLLKMGCNLVSRRSNMRNHHCKADQPRVVDYRSDTRSMPTPEMIKCMFEAKVGDDGYKEDPSVNALQKKMADILGKEAALYAPSGTMANLIAILTHCPKRGSEVIVGESSHILQSEQSGSAQVGGVQLRMVPNNPDGTFDLDKMLPLIRNTTILSYLPETRLICLENTHNWCNGSVPPQSWVKKVCAVAKENQLPVHMDGSRIFNAQTATGIPAKELVEDCDTINVCLSKGLGGPVGSVLVGPEEFIERAKFLRKVLGGGMRQIGFAAAAAIYALDNHIERLKEDHDHTRALAQAIHDAKSDVIKVNMYQVHTNILFFSINTEVTDSIELSKRLATVTEEELANGINTVVRILPRTPGRARMTVCLNNTKEDLIEATKKLQFVIKELDAKAKSKHMIQC